MSKTGPSWIRIALVLALAWGVPAIVFVTGAQQPAGSGSAHFTDVTQAAGIKHTNVCGERAGEKGWINESMGTGAAWLDYNGDGRLDLYLANGSTFEREAGRGEPNQLFRNDGKGRFTDVTAESGAGHRGWGYGVAVGDYDNDGDSDIYVANYDSDVLYRNDGDGTFTDVTTKAGIPRDDVWGTSAAFFDMENDGDLDLYVDNYMLCGPGNVSRRASPETKGVVACTYRGIPVFCGPLGQVPVQDVLYRNNGDGTFSDVTRESGVWLDKPRYALGVVTADYNNDGLQDIYVANDSVQNSLWKNVGHGRFVDVGVASLSAFNADGRPQAGMGTNFGDYNGDGWLDIVSTNFSYDLNVVYRNMAGKFFLDETERVGLGITNMNLSWGVGFYDFDHDTDLDLFIANSHIYYQVDGHDIGTRYRQKNDLFVNEGNGHFARAAGKAGPGMDSARPYRAVAFADYDDDGDMDALVTVLDEPPVLLRNDLTGGGHYLGVRLVGKQSNRDGIGARVIATVGGKKLIRESKGGGSYLSTNDLRLHFGLGKATRVETLEVHWPSGVKDVRRNVPADQIMTLEEGPR